MEIRTQAISRRAVLAMAGLGLFSCIGCAQGEHNEQAQDATQAIQDSLQSTFFAFDTACVIGGSLSRDILNECVNRCMRYEQLFSRTLATSDIGRINAAHGEPTQVAQETAELIRAALEYSRASDGLFDITIGAVSELWDFSAGIVPEAHAIDETLAHVGYEIVQVKGESITLTDPLAKLDLGGIAKGWVADALVDFLVAEGVTSAYINLGGNVCVLGSKADGKPWVVGVRDPNSTEGVVAKISCTGGSVVTSGLYERSFEKDGRQWWHILDPRTGYPVESNLVSASIFSERSIDGDGLTIPLFMMGANGALAFLESRDDLDGVIVSAAGEVLLPAGSAFSI